MGNKSYIHQDAILTILTGYCKKHHYDPQLIENLPKGCCVGLTSLSLYALWLEHQPKRFDEEKKPIPRDDFSWFNQLLQRILHLDLEKEPTPDPEIDRFISMMQFFQSPYDYQKMAQSDFHLKLEDTQNRKLHNLFNTVGIFKKKDFLKEEKTNNTILNYLSAENNIITISSKDHTTGLFIHDGKYYYYDANWPLGLQIFEEKDYDQLIDAIFLSNSMNIQEDNSLTLSFRGFNFNKDKDAKPFEQKNFLKPTEFFEKIKSGMQLNDLFDLASMENGLDSFKFYFDQLPPEEKAIALTFVTNKIHYPISANSVNGFKKLLELGADPTTDEQLLHYACKKGNKEIISLLLEKNKNRINLKNKNGDTALHIISQHGYDEVSTVLLEHKASADIRDKQNLKPSQIAARKGFFPLALRLRDAEQERKDTIDSELFYYACKYNATSSIEEMMEKKLDINPTIYFEVGESALYHAIKQGNLKCINEFIFKINLDIRKTTHLIHTNLKHTKKNQHEIFLSLLKAGVDPREKISSFSISYIAAHFGRLDSLKTLVEKYKLDISTPEKNGHTALSIAIEKNHTDCAEYLIERGADINHPLPNRMDCLLLAAKNSNLKLVNRLLDAKATPSDTAKDEMGNQLLHHLCHLGHIDTIKRVLEMKIDVNQKNNDGETPIFLAIKNGNLDVVKLLIQHGAQINIQNDAGFSPLYIASYANYQNIINELLISNADIDPSENKHQGNTLLHYAAGYGNTILTTALLREFSTPNIENNSKETPLHYAAEQGHVKIAQQLIEQKAEINVKEKNGLTPLHYAASKNHIDVVQLLIEYKADTQCLDHKGNSPIDYACSQGHLDIVKLLCRNIPDLKNNTNNKLLHQAVKSKNLELVQFLITLGLNINAKDELGKTPLMWAIVHETADMANLLISQGAHLNETDSMGNNALHLACYYGNFPLVKILVESKEINLDKKNSSDQSPLFMASKKGHFEIVDYLLKQDRQKNLRNSVNMTALHAASRDNHFLCVNALLNAGEDPELKDNYDNTPLHIMALNDTTDSMQVLFHHTSVSLEKTNKEGQTPLHLAVTYNKVNTARLLAKRGANIHALDNQKESPFSLIQSSEMYCALLFNLPITDNSMIALIRDLITLKSKIPDGQKQNIEEFKKIIETISKNLKDPPEKRWHQAIEFLKLEVRQNASHAVRELLFDFLKEIEKRLSINSLNIPELDDPEKENKPLVRKLSL